MKKLSILALSATLMTAPAFAQSNAHYSTTNSPTQSVDLSAVFDNSQDLQVATLSQQEMQETEGAWVPQAIGGIMGGVGGHFGYMAGAIASGSYNRNSHLVSITTGAGMGTLSPVNGARSFVQGLRATAFGVGNGAINSYASTTGQTINIR